MNFRKGILAAATAVAVATSGVAAAEAAETTTTATTTAAPTTSKPTPTVKKTTAKPTSKAQANDQGSSIKDMSPAEIRDWIAVFTAVIGALGTLFAFLDKYLRK